MARVLEGQLSASGLRFAIIVSRFNSFITERLLGGAMDALTRTGANADQVDLVKVPGSWEVPVVAGEMARQRIGSAIVLKDEHVVGVFTAVDALRALAETLTSPPETPA